jgi:sugar phosphate isomerase/epimerase
LLDLIDRPNVGANADLGNLTWTYDVPEESAESCIVALAPRLKYWHCKNLIRIPLPELKRTHFIRTRLADGEIEYRYMIAAVVHAGYDGCIALEGAGASDELGENGHNVAYVASILADLGVKRS